MFPPSPLSAHAHALVLLVLYWVGKEGEGKGLMAGISLQLSSLTFPFLSWVERESSLLLSSLCFLLVFLSLSLVAGQNVELDG